MTPGAPSTGTTGIGLASPPVTPGAPPTGTTGIGLASPPVTPGAPSTGTTGIGLASPPVTPGAPSTGTTGIGLASPPVTPGVPSTGTTGIGLAPPRAPVPDPAVPDPAADTYTGEVYGGDVYDGQAPAGDVYGGDVYGGDTYQGSVGAQILGEEEPTPGSLQRAFLWTSLVGLICAIGWFLIAKATGREFGFAAIGLGIAVGVTAAKGAGRGGRDVAALAVLMTLLSIVGGEYLVFKHVVMADFGIDLAEMEQEMIDYQERLASVERDGDYTDREVALLMGYEGEDFYDLDDEDLQWMREVVAEEDKMREQFGVDEDLEDVDFGAVASAGMMIGFVIWLVFSFTHWLFIGLGCYNALHFALRG